MACFGGVCAVPMLSHVHGHRVTDIQYENCAIITAWGLSIET